MISIAKSSVDDFLDEAWKLSKPHPFDRRIRLFGMIGVEMSKFDGMVHLSDIRNFGKPRQGGATSVLKKLTTLADKHKVKIDGVAKVYDQRDGHMSTTKELVKWYRKSGFKIFSGSEEDGYRIEYSPK